MRRSTHNMNSVWIRGLLALALVVMLPALTVPGATPAPAAAQDRLLTLNFVEADIVDVVKALAAQSGANVVVAGTVSGKKITLSLKDVTLEQALRLVTQPNGLDFRSIDGSYVVAPPEDLSKYTATGPGATRTVTLTNLVFEQVETIVEASAPGVTVNGTKGGRTVVLTANSAEALDQALAVLTRIDEEPARPTTKVVSLQHITANSVTTMLADAMPKVKVVAGPSAGTLLVSGMAPEVIEAVELIEAADAKPGPGATDFEVYQIRYGEPTQLMEKVQALVPDVQVVLGPPTITPILMDPSSSGGGDDWLRGPSSTSGGGSYTTTTSSTSGAGGAIEVSPITTLLLAGSPDAIGRAKALLAKIDVAPELISIGVLVAEGNSSDISQKGIDWTNLDAVGTRLDEVSGVTTDGTETGYADNVFKIARIQRTPFSLTATLSALINENKLHILSRPNISVLNGRQATLHSGQSVYYRKQVGIDDRGFPIFDIEQIPVGVTLCINPRMAEDGDIILTLQPIVSSLSDNPFFPDLPLVSTHRTLTTVRIKPGEVLVIAGLMRDSDEVITSGVPLLREVPIIGPLLFEHKTKRKISTELMIFIEPVPVQYRDDVEVLKPAS